MTMRNWKENMIEASHFQSMHHIFLKPLFCQHLTRSHYWSYMTLGPILTCMWDKWGCCSYLRRITYTQANKL